MTFFQNSKHLIYSKFKLIQKIRRSNLSKINIKYIRKIYDESLSPFKTFFNILFMKTSRKRVFFQ